MLFMETAFLCLLFFAICYLNTGSDEKNIKSYDSYPDEIQDSLKNNPVLAPKIKTVSTATSFFSNLVTFIIVFLILGVFIRENDFTTNFLNILFMGEVLNAFDFLVIDLLWWRNSPRIRFSSTKNEPQLYKSINKHFTSFLRGAVVFLLVAIIDGFILSIF